uniref:NADH-ubiquinone oxidoreductase chain 3 n=2 Tax=Lethocerinae TaxID=280092 RepID=A0A6S6MQQ3_9HEMI|nr:NADH dehydrogenase subunit 3 [Lethocerus deyrollei]BCH52384.1 NADH dehydrogenase subunit 3 [Kirkaldyia deyrolli]
MYMLMITATIALMISMGLMALCTVISKKGIMDQEKMSPFECGFDPCSSARIPFSIQFFLIAVLFLIFDIEIVIIMPMAVTMKTSMATQWFSTVSIFVLVILMGLFHEWKNGVLEWAK